MIFGIFHHGNDIILASVFNYFQCIDSIQHQFLCPNHKIVATFKKMLCLFIGVIPSPFCPDSFKTSVCCLHTLNWFFDGFLYTDNHIRKLFDFHIIQIQQEYQYCPWTLNIFKYSEIFRPTFHSSCIYLTDFWCISPSW